MSIDVDGQDFWVWMAFDYKPKVIIIECNGGFGPGISKTMQFNPSHNWDGTEYEGATFLAMCKLGIDKGYTCVAFNGTNAFFVRDDLVSNKEDFHVDKLFCWGVTHLADPQKRPWVQID